MAAACCPPGSWGAVAPPAGYVNKGSMETLGPNMQAYVVRPSSGAKSHRALIACPDIFGLDSGRTKLVCDDFAEKLGCMVILADVIEADPWVESWGMPDKPLYNLLWFIPWCRRHGYTRTLALFKSDIQPYLTKEGITSFAMFSFCYGAIPAEAFSSMPGAKGHVGFHPSHAIYGISFDLSLKKALSQVTCPQLWLVAANDQVKPGDASEQAVRDGAKQSAEIKVFDKQSHGWVNRGDVSKDHVRDDVEAALEMACTFFQKHLV